LNGKPVACLQSDGKILVNIKIIILYPLNLQRRQFSCGVEVL
jgi:hypothetical protein